MQHRHTLFAMWPLLLLVVCGSLRLTSSQFASSPDPAFDSPETTFVNTGPTMDRLPNSHPTQFSPPSSTQSRPPDIYTQGPGLRVGGSAREGHLDPGAIIQLPAAIGLRSYSSLQVRTCSPGPLLRQQGAQGDSLLLEVTDDGFPSLTITRLGSSHTVTADTSVVDNQWHHIFLRFEMGALSLGVDETLTEVVSSTGPLATMLDVDLTAEQPVLTVGGGAFSGCLLEGASVPLSQPLARHTGVQWGQCALPDGRNCSGYDTDPCFSAPCGNHGVCVATSEGTRCDCYARFTGPTCLIDMGPLCNLEENACSNGGMCEDDWRGNSTRCACAQGFTGRRCERAIVDQCDHNPCSNGGLCSVSPHADRIFCECPEGVSGQYCEVQRDECASNPCLHGGLCTDLTNAFQCNCQGTGYRGNTCSENIDECTEGESPCAEGATCYDLYGGHECACPPGHSGPRCDQVLDVCSSAPCLNNGTCQYTTDSTGFQCLCLPGFEGLMCEVNIDDCFGVPCPDNSFCLDGVNEYTCTCNPGHSGFPPDCVQINECDSNPCMNGASCLDESNGFTCVCAPGFTGAACEENIDECAGGPCLNGGECVDGLGVHLCSCAPGFTGTSCETNIDECTLGTCRHAASCSDTFGSYECVCEPGWQGVNCDEDINECDPNPCHNNASCTDRLGSFHCACPTGYTGSSCEIDRNECAGVTCLNGGTCRDGVNNYTCECLPAFAGLHCAERFDACSSQPCQHGGNCITTDTDGDQPGFYCECVPGFEGLLCSNNVDDCLGEVCAEGLVCHDLVNNFECRCPAGYTGDSCQEEINECDSTPCLNGGECHDAIANYTCVCPPGFSGHNCDEDVNECEVAGLCNNGICDNTLGSYQCYCRPGFSGDHCNLEFDECLSHPCRNNGTCINEINGYQCVCQPGFTGMDCEIEIDECEVEPCQNGATCIDGIAAFTCVCVPGFTDQLCSTNIDECEPVPCANGGQCLDGINAYTCNCSDTGFKGLTCEINIDDCEPRPCQHGSNCTDLIKDYECTCFTGYEGKDCEVDIPECATPPCLFGGTCLERSNRTLYELGLFEDFSYSTAGGYVCQCVPGFTGDNCEININECESSPCIHGECIDGINAYSCECLPGYNGEHCENEINECELLAPCQHGVCEDKIADYDCACHLGYGGKNCSVTLLGCDDVDCMNEGECEALLFDETRHDFVCHCRPGFTGRHCGEETTFSLAGSSYLLINSSQDNGYSLEFWFRTTLSSGTLAVGQGETYFILEMHDGRLNLHSSILNEYDGVFAGRDLNTGEWQRVQLVVNDTHALLAGGQDVFVQPITPVDNHTAFTTTVLGGATPSLKWLSKGAPFFTGCMQDAIVNGKALVPSQLPEEKKVAIVEGCPREEQCTPSPCHNTGRCLDLWNTFQCQCRRPYIGETCQLSFTAATFGNEAIRDSMVTVGIPADDMLTFRTHLDVSLLVRTRQPEGVVFYVGTHINDTNGSYVSCSLVDGRAVVRIMLAGAEESFTVGGPQLHDGHPHLLQVKRNDDQLSVYIDDVLEMNHTLTITGDFVSEVMYLGGLPPTTLPPSFLSSAVLSRVRRQLGTSNDNDDATADNSLGRDDGANFNPRPTNQFDPTSGFNPSPTNEFNPSNEFNPTPNFNPRPTNEFDSTSSFNPRPTNEFDPTSDFNPDPTNNFGTSNFNPNPTNNFDPNSGFNPSSTNDFNEAPDLTGIGFSAGANNNDDNLSVFSGDSSPSIDSTGPQLPPSSDRPDSDFFGTQTSPPDEGSESASLPAEFSGSSPLPFGFSPSDFPSSSPSTVFAPSSTGSSFEGGNPSTSHDDRTPTDAPSHFKGVIQDIRLSNGSSTRLVQPFLLRPVPGERVTLPGSSFNNTILHNVREGTVSDAACDSSPCHNGATCSVTWNDFSCECTFGFKGKACDELEYCARHDCPDSSTCRNLLDGFECLADHTMNGVNSSLVYRASLQQPPSVINELSIAYRSQVGGALLWAELDLSNVAVLLAPFNEGGSVIFVRQTYQSQVETAMYVSQFALDGDWHTVNVTLDTDAGLMVALDNISLSSENTSNGVIVNFTSIALSGTIRLGRGQNLVSGFNLIQEDYEDASSPDPESLLSLASPNFRGCLGEVRVQDVLLPAFSPDLLVEDTAANKFVLTGSTFQELGCRVCFEHECEHGGHCHEPESNFTCSCPSGFEGDLCEVNINDCVDHLCQNGAFCRDGIDMYTCDCMPGYEGDRCQTEINECDVMPCENNGTCTDGIAMFTCACTEDYIGDTCADLKINNCQSKKCQNNATCQDQYVTYLSQLHQQADNYTCTCLFGYGGYNCDIIVDYCDLESVDCHWGACRLSFQQPGWRCDCNPGYKGEFCDEEIDECESSPCKNGATCTDKLLGYDCECASGWQGEHCDIDIDECALNPCQSGSTCNNLQGSFLCLCSEGKCGQSCALEDPCQDWSCDNNGECMAECDEQLPDYLNKTHAFCECQEGWGGDTCAQALSALSGTALIILIAALVTVMIICAIVGLVIFLMMAKKKRATRGTYSPSRQEFYSPRVEMDAMMKPPPEERLI